MLTLYIWDSKFYLSSGKKNLEAFFELLRDLKKYEKKVSQKKGIVVPFFDEFHLHKRRQL